MVTLSSFSSTVPTQVNDSAVYAQVIKQSVYWCRSLRSYNRDLLYCAIPFQLLIMCHTSLWSVNEEPSDGIVCGTHQNSTFCMYCNKNV